VARAAIQARVDFTSCTSKPRIALTGTVNTCAVCAVGCATTNRARRHNVPHWVAQALPRCSDTFSMSAATPGTCRAKIKHLHQRVGGGCKGSTLLQGQAKSREAQPNERGWGSETHSLQRRRTGLTNPGHIGSMGWSDWLGMATGHLLHKSHVHYIQPMRRNSTATSSLSPRPTHHHKHMHDQHPLLGLGRTVRALSN
jgi:hypothetical protein